jgi:YD repeat-containing protein
LSIRLHPQTRTRRASLDNMGRLQEARADDPVGGAVSQTRQYNALSQLSSSSLPFRAGQTSYANTYDYVGSRPSLVTLAQGGTIQYSYDLNTATVTNTDGKRRKYGYQEDGKVSQVLEEDSAGGLTVATNYAYDKLSRLQTITQGSQTRTFTYDALGRLKTEKHPESSAAGSSYSYTYDANSNILTKTDARGITTTFVYDELNRVTSKSYSDGTPPVTYFYDSQPAGSPISIQNPVGRLTKRPQQRVG